MFSKETESVLESVGPGTQISVDKREGFGREKRDGWSGAIGEYEDCKGLNTGC